MKVKVEVEFEVTGQADGADSIRGFTERIARDAAELAVYNNVVLTEGNGYIAESVTQWVDGYGNCTVRVVE